MLSNYRALFLLLLLMSDVMAVHFFFKVSPEGSWLEIGTSLSHFIIAEATAIFLLVFYGLGHFLLAVSRSRRKEEEEY